MQLKCYGKEYNPNTEKCQVCEYAKWCINASDIKFYSGRHGEPSIVTTGDLSQIRQASAITHPGRHHTLSDDVLLELLRVCDCDPMNVAIVIARHGGLTYEQIGRAFGASRQVVLYRIKQLKSPELASYLRNKRTSKYFTTSIKLKTLEGLKAKQMEFKF